MSDHNKGESLFRKPMDIRGVMAGYCGDESPMQPDPTEAGTLRARIEEMTNEKTRLMDEAGAIILKLRADTLALTEERDALRGALLAMVACPDYRHIQTQEMRRAKTVLQKEVQ